MTSASPVDRPPGRDPGAASRARARGGHEPSAAALDRLAELIAASPHNLVSRGERQHVRDVHVPECLAVGRVLAPEAGSRWLDLGTGGGLPGLVLALQFPDVAWTLVDATGKKVQAVRASIAELGIENAQAVHGRAEVLGDEAAYHAAYDGVVSRAVAPLAVLLGLARGFLGDGGLLAAIKGPHVDAQIAAADRTRRTLRFGVIHKQDVAGTVRPTCLVTMRAQGPPPRRGGRPGASNAAPRGGRR